MELNLIRAQSHFHDKQSYENIIYESITESFNYMLANPAILYNYKGFRKISFDLIYTNKSLIIYSK